MLDKKYKEDMDIAKIPTFQKFSTEIMNGNCKLFDVSFSIDGHLHIHHENPNWDYGWHPSVGQFLVDKDNIIVNPWTVKKEFHGAVTKYMFLYNGTDKCEIYVDQTKHIATIVYIDHLTNEVASKSFSIFVKEKTQ